MSAAGSASPGWALRIPGWWVHLYGLRPWVVAHCRPVWLLWPSWGLHQVGRCLGHWSSHHRLPGFYVHMRSCDCFYQAQQHAWSKHQAGSSAISCCLGWACPTAWRSFFISKPSPVICALRRLGLGTSFCCLLLSPADQDKLHCPHLRWGKEWLRGQNSSARSSQVFICLGLILVQIVVVPVWLILEAPRHQAAHPSREAGNSHPKCNVKDSSMLISLTYDVVLGHLVHCVCSFKNAEVPRKLNQAKFIGFTMYTTCIIWLAFLPIFYVTSSDYRVSLGMVSPFPFSCILLLFCYVEFTIDSLYLSNQVAK